MNLHSDGGVPAPTRQTDPTPNPITGAHAKSGHRGEVDAVVRCHE
jgi:hypothetical protein